MSRRLAARCGVFLFFFALYVWTSPPTLSPYRDAGEMATAAYSLGVAHPPSYPVYVLLGHLAEKVPLGNPAYRLGLLSAAAGAGALAVLFSLLGARLGPWAGLGAVLLLGTNATFWSVCQVQEMYSLTILLAAVLLALAHKLGEAYSPRLLYSFALLYGVALGNRTDILLWAPGLALLAWPGRLPPRRTLIAAAGFALAGLAVYLFLPLRSLRGPWLDWNHPSELYNFVGSLTRRGYGGTLDLLSKNYAPGELFLPNMKALGRHLWENFSLPGLALAGLGLRRMFQVRRREGAGTLLLYAASGPLFLYLANLPPNPHALAIVDPHYLLSDLVAAVWAAEGLAAVPSPGAPALAALLAASPFLTGRWGRMDRRGNLIGYDFTLNALRCAPPGSALVSKKDVQIFSLWYAQRVEGRRPDLRVAAQGLAHSPWYQAAQAREGVRLSLGSLRGDGDWARFLAENGETYATMDADLPSTAGEQRGLLVNASSRTLSGSWPAEEFLLRRGDYRSERRPDFFTSDLIDSLAAARERRGAREAGAGQGAAARRDLMAAWSMKRLYPEALAFIGYLAFRSGDIPGGIGYYQTAVKSYEETLRLAAEYHALPDILQVLKRAASEACLNLGAIYEKGGQRDQAERLYFKALDNDPSSSKAHYNLAVLFWGKDWPRVIGELEAAQRLDPANPEIGRFLLSARVRSGAAGR